MSSPKSRREQYSEATRAALLDTATATFAERGYLATSLDDIAAATQVTRGAVYHHFANKRALFEAVLDVQQQVMVQRVLGDAAAHAPDPWAAAMAGLDAFLDGCCDPVYARLCWLEAPIALGWERWHELELDHSYGMIEKFATALIQAGLVAQVSISTMAGLVFHLLGGAGRMIAEAEPARTREVRDSCSHAMRLMMAGLRAT